MLINQYVIVSRPQNRFHRYAALTLLTKHKNNPLYVVLMVNGDSVGTGNNGVSFDVHEPSQAQGINNN